MTPTVQQSRPRPGRRSPHASASTWGAALPPSQRHAASRRAAAEYELIVRRWLRDLARR